MLFSAISEALVPAKTPSCPTRTASSSELASTSDDKTEVREYFNTEGFNRWNKIYSESDDVNSVQLDIRTGHDQTIQKILKWVQDDGDISGKSVCDCGCGLADGPQATASTAAANTIARGNHARASRASDARAAFRIGTAPNATYTPRP